MKNGSSIVWSFLIDCFLGFFVLKMFRDPKEKMSLFGTPMSTESPVEKQLRETGEWIADKTEASFRSAGTDRIVLKNIILSSSI